MVLMVIFFCFNLYSYFCRQKTKYCGIMTALEKPSAFAPRGQATLTLTGKIRLTLCGKIKLTPECDCHSGAFL